MGDFHKGEVYKLMREVKETGGAITHADLTGGKCSVPPNMMANFRAAHVSDIKANRAAPLSEQRTLITVPYFDIDLKAAAPLDDARIEGIARTATAQVRRFYADREAPLECVVCGTSAVALEEGGFKVGLHMHFPQLRVDEPQMLLLRMGIVARLSADDDGVDWAAAIDRSVYSNGLRMVGAPKAKKCSCKGKDPFCSLCGNNHKCHILDPRCYMLHQVFVDGAPDEAQTAGMRANLMRVLQATSVRTDATTTTPGFARYPGCPEDDGRKSGGKRKLAADDVPRSLKKCGPVDSCDVKKVMRELLMVHSRRYEHTTIQVYRTSDKKDPTLASHYLVTMSLDNATFCKNRIGPNGEAGSEHGSNRVYMEVRWIKEKNAYRSCMKCHCAKPRIGVWGEPCSTFASLQPIGRDQLVTLGLVHSAKTPAHRLKLIGDKIDAQRAMAAHA